MKKDDLKSAIKRLQGEKPYYHEQYVLGRYNAYQNTLNLIDQLEEPEITKEQLSGKQELIKAIENHLEETKGENAMGTFDQGYEEGMDYATGLIEHYIKEPEQVVPSKKETTTPTVSKKEIVEIPQFVADWIESKRVDNSIYGLLKELNEKCDSESRFSQWRYKETGFSANFKVQGIVAKAWANGYTVEQPKLLTVIVKDYDKTIMTKQIPVDEVNKMMEGME